MKKYLLFILIFISVNTFAVKNIWIEAEQFDNLGGWTVDWQFIDQMGSPFLMAIGYGEPVENATTTVKVEKPGKYRLWVRTRDWVPGHNAGAFTVSVDGKDYGYKFGISGNSIWGWEKGPIYNLKKSSQIELKDLTGYYGRCDAIVLSSDENWEPPVKLDEINDERLLNGSLSSKITPGGEYDVVVIGGGLSGCIAAVSAARQGARTVLIQNRGELGGNASLENIVPPVGSTNQKLSKEEIKYNPRETGIIEEIALPYGPQRYAQTGKNWPAVLLKLVDSEPNLDLHLYTHAFNVKMKNDSLIESVECVQVPQGKRISFKGKIFIDCTGNGVVGLKAGAEYMYGTEGKHDFGESMAPENRTNNVMPSSLKYWYEPTNDTVKYEAPSWAFEYKRCDLFNEPEKHLQFKQIDHQWIIELGGNDSIWYEAEKVRDDLLKLIYGIWDHQKNYCTRLKNEAWKYKLVWVSHVLGMRESYRLKGDYIMTQDDVVKQIQQKDRIAYGGWGLDNHATSGYTENVRVNREKNHTHPGAFFSIPYRSLYSKNIGNLMMGGRNISVSHLALSATRVMYTLAVIGQASGTAAGMCVSNNCYPKDIYYNYLEALQQQLMKDGAYLIEKKNEDPKDLALRCNEINVSSGFQTSNKVINGYSRARLSSIYPYPSKYELNAWCPTNDDSNCWISLKWNSLQKFNVIHLSFLTSELSADKIDVEYLKDGKWIKVTSVDNNKSLRRLVIPFEQVSSESVRISLHDMPVNAGVCEVRVYNESIDMIKQIERINRAQNMPDKKIVFPWQK